MDIPIKQEEIIFRSKLPDIYIPKHLPLHSYCLENISEFSRRPCLINGATNEVYTYEEVELTARKVAAGLSKLGVQQGETIMLLLPNSPEYVFAFLGASYIGAVTTMANPYFTPAEVIKQAKASAAKLIITQACYVDKVRDYAADTGVKVMCIDAPPAGCLSFTELTSADEREMPAVKIHPEDAVALPYSSGTTGLPKGVMLTHKGLVTSVAQQVDGENPNLYIHSEDVMLCVLPLFHIYSLNSVLLCGLRVGAAILIMQKFDIVPFLELMQKYKVTIGPFVPPIVLTIVKSPLVGKYDISSVRMVMSGAAPLGKELEDAVRTKFPNAKLGQGYGMTEAGPVLSMCLAFAKEPFEIKSGACGTVVRNAEMKIVDPQTGASLGRNQSGEICIRGDQIMKGYLNDPESTKNTVDQDGWLHTGDIGFIDADDELFIVDRLKEIIKYKGFQVAPAEIEALLLNHPYISDAAVVSMIDEQAGEVPVAFVVRSNGSAITEDEIKQFISKQFLASGVKLISCGAKFHDNVNGQNCITNLWSPIREAPINIIAIIIQKKKKTKIKTKLKINPTQTSMALCFQIPPSLTKSKFFSNPKFHPKKASNFVTICCSQSENAASKEQKKLSKQSSWEAEDSEGKDYLYRLGAEADNMNIAVGARAGIIDDLFTGNFLGKDSDIVFDYRQKATRSFEYLQGDYYIAPLFLDKVVVHITKNFMANLLNVKVPLILGIWGGKGQGKTFQTELIFRAMGVEPIIMSAGELESERAGEPGRLIRERYRAASQVVQNQGKMSCLVINDIDAGLGIFGNTQMTVNNQIVAGTIMNIADNPTRVSIGQGWREADVTHRIPIIVTGNDFARIYAPLIRDGRMDKFYWQPTQEDIINIVRRMYEKDGITRDEVVTIVREFPNQALDFYGALRSRTYDRSILEWVNDAGGAENLGSRLLKQKKAGKLPVFTPPEQTVEALLQSGFDLIKEQKLIMDTKLSKEYMKNMDD